jgi:CRISPR-associated exonuclease Cas4
MALPLVSKRLNLSGVADLVEFRTGPEGEVAFPVEYKRGKAKRHRADEVQLCAQGLCLEEMTGRPVPEGALFYAETKRRVVVPFDTELRQLTEQTALQFAALFSAGRTPPAVWRADRCRACSLLELCRPKAGQKSALAFRNRAIAAALDEADASDPNSEA